MSISSSQESRSGKQQTLSEIHSTGNNRVRPNKRTGQHGDFRSTEEIGENFIYMFSLIIGTHKT